MKNIVLILIFSSLFYSCAHTTKRNGIADQNLDGLRFESLNRYDIKRLQSVKSSKTVAFCHSGEFSKALNNFKKQLDKKKNDALYWNKIGTCYLLKNELPKAKFYFDLALRTAKKSKKKLAIIKNNLGLYFNLLNKDADAISSFEESVKANRNYLTPKYNLSQIYLRFGLYDKARNILNKLYKAAPKDIDFLASLGHLNLMTGKYKESVWYYSKIPATHIKKDNYATNYALALYLKGDLKSAQKIISEANQNDSYYTITQTNILKKIKDENK